MRIVRNILMGATFCGLGAGIAAIIVIAGKHNPTRPALTKEDIAQVLSDQASFYRFPVEANVPLSSGETVNARIRYTFDPALQEAMENEMKNYKPDYGAFVAVDATTGRVLSMVSYSRDPKMTDNLALRATFPSASVFKVVTAAAAIEEKNFSANTVIPFNGRSHTLYRGQILRDHLNRWTRYITLKQAFAQSINTVFGKIGANELDPKELSEYASRFGFNHAIASDMPMQEGHAPIPQDRWGIAETASGFTRDNTMSPLQGALIAAAVVNDGQMMEPYVVENVSRLDGQSLYSATPRLSSQAVDKATAGEIRNLMYETVAHGTSRGSFRRFFRGEFADLKVGGKTGSLTGLNPKGRYDWFVGFADDGFHKIAVCALTVHKEFWRVKSSYLARLAFERYLKGHIRHEGVALNLSPSKD